ncbi:MAG: CoA pyrophosphatase [Bacteroidales bacterium]|jgi:8-oxo-dGTP pyrophosphatase MutT (NUDIX family)
MITFNQFSEEVRYRLKHSVLPGISVQLRMAPPSRQLEIERSRNQVPRKSAVLICFFPKNGEAHLIMIKRAVDETVHSGQIAFPGGKAEKEDISLENTALRETFEEVGIQPKQIEIIGKLSDLYIPPSNFLVTPFVGIIQEEPHLRPNYEVERVLVIPLSDLMNQANCVEKTISVRSTQLRVPCFTLDGEIVWGATSMMLAELLEITAHINLLGTRQKVW